MKVYVTVSVDTKLPFFRCQREISHKDKTWRITQKAAFFFDAVKSLFMLGIICAPEQTRLRSLFPLDYKFSSNIYLNLGSFEFLTILFGIHEVVISVMPVGQHLDIEVKQFTPYLGLRIRGTL